MDVSHHSGVDSWVREVALLCQPDRIHWCDGSPSERETLFKEAVAAGELIALDSTRWPGCYLHRSDPNDVARSEELTFICTPSSADAGPTNHWMAPRDAYARLTKILRGSMKGRSLYVVPFVMGLPGSAFAKIGVEITDSRYVVLNMGVMTHMGDVAWKALGANGTFTKCLHGQATLNPDERLICHFPQDNTIWSVGSAYGGNALLGKKCMALRIASAQGRAEGWMAEHMLIAGVENPQGEIHYIAAAFPSACGKTNLAMLLPPASLPGYKIWTVGDDIAWMRIGADGRLWAMNPEAGFFGVAPGTSDHTNPQALRTIHQNTLFTNVLQTDENDPWWEGLSDAPARGTNWAGHPWTPLSEEKGAHPNARFTSPLDQCPSLSPRTHDRQGVPISAIFFGARRARVAPLICQARNWNHGVFLGATMASETTAAANGPVGIVRRDPMAMRPFIGYHAGDYFQNWLDMGKKLGAKAPMIFHVNWFRKARDGSGRILWPGFRENLRPLVWALDRCAGRGDARDTPLGLVPTPGALPTQGLALNASALDDLLAVDPNECLEDLLDQKVFFDSLGDKLPAELRAELDSLTLRLTPQKAA